ncbi:MAG: TIGR00730 family Rossman fold protein [Phascolarctobacterium sp.]|nr:TIGR00730 family Rossman fold protein [Phascolarctobacterium sp.]
MKICVFCSSSEGLANEYYEAGFEVGKLIAEGGHTLVFGGYTKGIMGAVAQGCKENGGKVVSVIPAIFDGIRANFEDGADVINTETMSSRKDKMIEIADAFISLPGGVGTVDELFQVIALNAVGEISKPVAILMQGKTQKFLGEFLWQGLSEGFVPKKTINKIGICHTPQELLDYVQR